MLDVAAAALPVPRARLRRRLLRRPGRLAGAAAVIDAMAGCLRESNANLGGAFATSRAADEVMERARAAAADFTGGEPEGIAFGANMTTLNFLLAHAVARTLEPGDEIVVTALDHDANVSPWLLVAEDHDLVVRTAPLRRRGRDARRRRARGAASASAREWWRSRSRRTRSARSPTPARIAAAAHARRRAGVGGRACTSRRTGACARASSGSTSLLCSPYKFFGPAPGDRGDPARPGRVAARRPGAARRRRTPPGHRFETGTQSHEAIAGAIAAIDYLRDARRRRPRRRRSTLIEEHETQLTRALPRAACRTASSCTGSATPRGPHADVLLQRRRAPPARGGRAARASRTSTSGTATTTPSSRCAPWGSPTAAAPSAPASSTTRPRTRSTACSKP